MLINSSNILNVEVTDFVLHDNPASIEINLKVSNKKFYSKIIYHSIPSWQEVWAKCLNENVKKRILGTLVAWDCMRFLALGGEELILCEGLALDEKMQKMWHYCFMNQFGEWRYRNNFHYRDESLPRVVLNENQTKTAEQLVVNNLNPQRNEKHIITNGGGKDSLVGMLLMNDAKIIYDIYEGYLPIGGEHELQKQLLDNLSNAVANPNAKVVQVTVEDDFYNCDDNEILKLGVSVDHYKCDFAVGHTANYPGYFPIVIYHEYSHVWFNIEASADRSMLIWNGESINHQWCKTKEYQAITSELYQHITKDKHFKGFSSTIRGLYDTHIYSIAISEEQLLKKTHSCNCKKPWCLRCPKCCFSYLMIASFKGEDFAMEVVGSEISLFDVPENTANFESLLDTNQVAWECVASHEECLLALLRCQQLNIDKPVLNNYLNAAKLLSKALKEKYVTIKPDQIPSRLRASTLLRFSCANVGDAVYSIKYDKCVNDGANEQISMIN